MMKSDKRHHRRKSQNQLQSKGTSSNVMGLSSRIIGFPYEQALKMPKKERNLIGKGNVIGAKAIVTTDCHKIERQSKEFSSKSNGNSTKNRIPRFNSEQGVKEGYMVPTLWHKAEEKQVAMIDPKGNTTVIKNSLQTKMLEKSMMEKNFTPNIIEAHSVEKIQLKNQIQAQNTRAKVILTQQNQHQYQNNFKRQRSNFSTLGRTTEALSNNIPVSRADTSLIQESSKQVQKIEQTTEIKNSEQPRYEQYHLIEKPNILTQPQLTQPKIKSQEEASEMLVLLTNTTKHLHQEAKRIVDNLNANQILAMSHVQQAQALFKDHISRQSSPNLHNNVDINSPKSMKLSPQRDNFDYEVKIQSPKGKDTDTSNYSPARTIKPHSKTSTDFHCRETKAPIQFKQKYPQTRIRADQPLHKSAQNHHQSADYNSTVTNYKSSQKGFFQRQKPGSVMDETVNLKKESTKESSKPKDNAAANSAESVDIKQALQLPETNTNEEKTNEASKLSSKKRFSMPEQQQDVVKKMATTMPKIYKTPQVGLDTKYNRTSNLQRRLDAVKQEKIQQNKKNTQSNYKSIYRQQEGPQSPKNANHRNSLTGPSKVSTVYPVLANQGTSKFQMPILSQHAAGGDSAVPSGSAAAASRQYSNHPVYTQAAPKFMPANSIKVHQAEAAVRTMSSSNNQKSDSINYISSYRNLHQQQNQLMNYGSGTFGGHTASSFNKRGRPTFKMGPNGKLILNRPKHCLADSTSQSSNNEDSDNQDHQDSPTKKQENEGQSQEDQPQQQSAEQQQNTSNQGQSLPPISNANNYQEQNQHQSQEEGDAENTGGKTLEKKKKIKKVKGPKLVFNLYYTVYPLIKRVAKQNNFKVRTDDIQLVPPAPGTEEYFARQSGYMPQGPPPDFDVSWIDNSILPEVLSKVKPYQRISQFPGISVITNKKKLASGLMKMYKRFPDEFQFFPQTYILPQEYVEFKSQFEKYARILHGNSAKKASAFRNGGSETYIIKPDNMCQGRGIYLVNDPTEVDPNGENVVAQKYITNPFLLDDLKFDIRLYVLLIGVNPLRVYLFKDGLVRLATEPYVQPTDDNIDNLFMHLTNYAINKNNEAFVQNSADESDQDWYDDGTHKRSFKSLIYTLKCMGKPYKKLKEDINDLLIKTLIVAQPSLQHLYKSCQPDDLENQLCFQILGFDVMIDEDCKPWLIEVNQSPSFKADSGLDKRIKEKLVTNTLNLLNLSVKRKQKWIIQNKKIMQQRMITGKKIKYTPEEKEALIAEKQQERDEFEKANVGKFRLIYPCEDEPGRMDNYDRLLKASQECWEQFTTGKRGRKPPQNSGANATMNNKESMRDMRADALDASGKPVWRGSGSVVNYMPAWEKNYQKSIQQKQARQASYQQQNSAELNMVFSARNQDMTSTRGSGNPFKSQTKGMKSKSNFNRGGDKSPAKATEMQGKRGVTLIQKDDSTCNIVGAESQLENHEIEIQRSPRSKKQQTSPSYKKQLQKEMRVLETTAQENQDESLPLSIEQLKTPVKGQQKMKSPRKRSRLSNISQTSSNKQGQASQKGQSDDQGDSPQM